MDQIIRRQRGHLGPRGRDPSTHSVQSGISAVLSNSVFFEEQASIPEIHTANKSSVITQSQTWKSAETKQREEFVRTRNLLEHFVPEHFSTHAYPTNEPADIVPHTFLLYQIHQKEMDVEKMKDEIALREAKRNREALESIRPAFDGKIFQSGRSSVLCQYTIWSNNFEPTAEHPAIPWPAREQFHEDGEKRENKFAPTRCGRFLPALRHPDTGFFVHQYPLDQVGPLRSQGPTPAECRFWNDHMDSDEAFAKYGLKLFGDDLASKVGVSLPGSVAELE